VKFIYTMINTQQNKNYFLVNNNMTIGIVLMSLIFGSIVSLIINC